MENVVTVIFDVESEAYQAFTELRQVPFGKDYVVAEAALIKHEGNEVVIADLFDAAAITTDDTAAGMMIGSIVGILGGPLGVLLGAGAGAYTGLAFDTADAVDSASMLEVTAAKLYEGETAIVALVEEDEPAFDAPFAKFKTTIIRHFAADVLDEVDLARQVEADLIRQARGQLHAERKAELKARHEERVAAVKARFDELKADVDKRTDEVIAEAKAQAEAVEAENKQIVDDIQAEAEAKIAEYGGNR